MRSLNLVEPGVVAFRDAKAPTLTEATDVLVQPTAVALCDGDVAAIAGAAPFPTPYLLGHEFVATVIERGSVVTQVEVGDQVIVPFQISCGACPKCVAGHTGNCAAVPRLSMYGFGAIGGPWGGALSDVVRVP